MLATFRVLIHMGSLQRLFPLWLIGLALIAINPALWMVGAIVYGMVLQFFVEYVMHRFLLHREPPTEQGTFNELYRSHIGHHEFPTNPEFFTGSDHWYAFKFGLTSVVVHGMVLTAFIGWHVAFTFAAIALFVGSVSAFAFYEFCHTLAHLKVPKGWFGKKITHSHLRHHFNDHEATFHVSLGMGWIDHLFGTTYSREKAKERFDPDTILSMGMDPEDLRLVTARKAYGLPATPRRNA